MNKMNRWIAASTLALMTLPGVARAQDAAKTETVKIPASGETATQALVASPRHGEWIDVPLPGGNTKIHSWISYPERKDKAPVVLVIHEIFGLSDWVRAVADQLAAEGFIAVAPDFLSGQGPNGGGTESFAGDAVRGAIQKLTRDDVTARLDAVRDYALALPSAATTSATIGFCWGGGQSFSYATQQPKLDAAVVYYGTAPTERDVLEKIACPILGHYGGDDARVTSTVEPTSKTMAELKKTYTSFTYEGAGHGFMRQQDGREGANLKAAQGAWAKTIEFLKLNLAAKKLAMLPAAHASAAKQTSAKQTPAKRASVKHTVAKRATAKRVAVKQAVTKVPLPCH